MRRNGGAGRERLAEPDDRLGVGGRHQVRVHYVLITEVQGIRQGAAAEVRLTGIETFLEPCDGLQHRKHERSSAEEVARDHVGVAYWRAEPEGRPLVEESAGHVVLEDDELSRTCNVDERPEVLDDEDVGVQDDHDRCRVKSWRDRLRELSAHAAR